jgi:hypothetical protein
VNEEAILHEIHEVAGSRASAKQLLIASNGQNSLLKVTDTRTYFARTPLSSAVNPACSTSRSVVRCLTVAVAHRDERDAVRESPLLVLSLSVEGKTPSNQLFRKGSDVGRGIPLKGRDVCDRRSSGSGRGPGISNFRHSGTRRHQLNVFLLTLVDELDGTVVVLIVFPASATAYGVQWCEVVFGKGARAQMGEFVSTSTIR